MNELLISCSDDVADLSIYNQQKLVHIFNHTLNVMYDKIKNGLFLPYFIFEETFCGEDWINLPKSLDIYICGVDEGRELNLNARGKDYATNILSYPSGLPNTVYQMMNCVVLGELVICHDVIMREADEQGKTPENHLTHLIIHGILHLLGFDHELGQEEQDQMEGFEIQILSALGIDNPYT